MNKEDDDLPPIEPGSMVDLCVNTMILAMVDLMVEEETGFSAIKFQKEMREAFEREKQWEKYWRRRK